MIFDAVMVFASPTNGSVMVSQIVKMAATSWYVCLMEQTVRIFADLYALIFTINEYFRRIVRMHCESRRLVCKTNFSAATALRAFTRVGCAMVGRIVHRATTNICRYVGISHAAKISSNAKICLAFPVI